MPRRALKSIWDIEKLEVNGTIKGRARNPSAQDFWIHSIDTPVRLNPDGSWNICELLSVQYYPTMSWEENRDIRFNYGLFLAAMDPVSGGFPDFEDSRTIHRQTYDLRNYTLVLPPDTPIIFESKHDFQTEVFDLTHGGQGYILCMPKIFLIMQYGNATSDWTEMAYKIEYKQHTISGTQFVELASKQRFYLSM